MRRTKVWITPPSLVRIIFLLKRSLEVGRISFWISNDIYSKRINTYTGSILAEGYAGDLKLHRAIKSNRFEKENFPAATILVRIILKKWRNMWLVRILKSIVQCHRVCCSYQFWVFITSYAIVFFMYLFLARDLDLYICFDLILAAYLIIWQISLLPCQKYFDLFWPLWLAFLIYRFLQLSKIVGEIHNWVFLLTMFTLMLDFLSI